MLRPAMPLRFDRGRVVTVEQDSAADVAQCVEAAARTRLGSRPEAPEFGLPSYLMLGGGGQAIDLDELRAHLLDSEPRAAVVVDLVQDVDDLRTARIHLLIDEET